MGVEQEDSEEQGIEEKDFSKDDHTVSPVISESDSRADHDHDLEKGEGPVSARTGSFQSVESHETAPAPAATSIGLKISRPPSATSRASSIRRDPIIVPRRQRRGLLAHLTIIPEVENPYDLARRRKWTITATVAFAAIAAPSGSSIVFPALNEISNEFHTTPFITNMSVAFYMLSMSIFPLWWSSFSETLGRRTIYVVSFLMYVLFNILSAVSINISMFIVTRLLAGGAAASVQAVGAGTVADIWEVKERGQAMGYFYLGPLCGPLLAPIIGGVLTQTLGWRSTMWSQVIYGGVLWVAIVFLLPETLKSRKPFVSSAEASVVASAAASTKSSLQGSRPALVRSSTRQSAKVKSKKYVTFLHQSFVDPLKIILHLRKPPVAICVYYAAITFSALYFLNVSIQDVFTHAPYNYNSLIVGLLYIPNSIGYFLASIFGGRWVDKIMLREAKKANRFDVKGKPIFRPEDRMKENIWIATFMFPLALIWYGWTADKGVNIAAPMIANFFFGIGSMLVFGCLTTMLTEFMPNQSSHGIAVNNFVRNILSCAGALVAEPAISGIGNGWLFTILGLVTLVSGIVVIPAMSYYAARWRKNVDKAAASQ